MTNFPSVKREPAAPRPSESAACGGGSASGATQDKGGSALQAAICLLLIINGQDEPVRILFGNKPAVGNRRLARQLGLHLNVTIFHRRATLSTFFGFHGTSLLPPSPPAKSGRHGCPAAQSDLQPRRSALPFQRLRCCIPPLCICASAFVSPRLCLSAPRR